MTLPMAIPMVSIPGADAAKKAASDIATGVKDVTNGMKDTATTVKNTIDFASDPMGYMAKELQSADHWLVSNLFGAMLKVVHPDYSKDWFTNCYRISFAIAFMGMIFLVIKLMLDRAAGRISGEELVNSLALRAPAWVVGVSLGPSIAAVILGAVGVLTDGVATWMGTSPVDIIKSLSEQIDKADFGAVAGGSLIAIAIFFLLLLSLSEHIAFWQAYLVSAVACIGLQGFYLSGVLRSWGHGLGFATRLTLLYGVLYLLLASENNALLMGSLLLFGILAAIMWLTRKVDWYDLGGGLR